MALGGKKLPASFWPLLILALAAVIFLLLRGRDEETDLIGGGPVMPYTPEQITGLELVRIDGRYRLEKQGEQWRLSGTVADDVGADAVADFLRALSIGTGGAIMAGTEPRDRRYGFGGPRAATLRIETAAGEQLQIDFGDYNPVTKTCYASGAGRSGVFPVTAEFRDLMIRMPELVRITTLLPPFERSRVTALRIWRRAAEPPLQLALRDRRWWLREPPAGLEALGSLVRDYNRFYEDRRRGEDGDRWLQADRRRIDNLIYEVSETGVIEAGPLRPTPDFLEQVGLNPPYRRVELSFADEAEPLLIELGEKVELERVHARRRGNLVIAHSYALKSLEMSTASLVDTDALGFSLVLADSLRLIETSATKLPQPLLWARRSPVGEADSVGLIASGGGIWTAVVPPDYKAAVPVERLSDQAQDRVVDLDRLPIESVLPPFGEADGWMPADSPLAASPRFTLTAWVSGGGAKAREEVVFGRLAATWPPQNWPGAEGLARFPDGTPVLYDPISRQLLVVPEEVLISFRAMRGNLFRAQ